jgi:Na+(H+)/acetate symporter ActP
VEDKTCFLFGVKKPSLLAHLTVVLFAIAIATLVVLLSTSCCDGFTVVAGGLSGVTFVSVVDTCLLLVSHHHPLGMEDNHLKKRGK